MHWFNFFELKKAFGTVSHSILLQKLEHCGIRGNTLNLFTSYLTEREQYVSVKGSCLSLKIVKAECIRDQTLALYSSQYMLMTS